MRQAPHNHPNGTPVRCATLKIGTTTASYAPPEHAQQQITFTVCVVMWAHIGAHDQTKSAQAPANTQVSRLV